MYGPSALRIYTAGIKGLGASAYRRHITATHAHNQAVMSSGTRNTLFESCALVVLGSPYILGRASLYLPRDISYFLLYHAFETRNQLAVKKLIEKWPHGDLTLNFLAESSLCRRNRCNTPHCLEPHEYMDVFGSYARYSSHEIVASVLEGVFYNVYCYHSATGGERLGLGLGLCRVDMCSVIIDTVQGT